MSKNDKTLRRVKIIAYKDDSFSKASELSDLMFTADFNPSEYTLSKTNSYDSKNSADQVKPQTDFSVGDNDKLSMTLLFDGSGVQGKAGSVMPRVKNFMKLMQYQGESHMPPFVKVVWGQFTFQGVVTSASAQFVLFNKSGVPLRAKIATNFEQVMSKADRTAAAKRSSPDVHRVWPVVIGDRLDRIAFEKYGDAGYATQIAAHNYLGTMRQLRPGHVLSLPRLEH